MDEQRNGNWIKSTGGLCVSIDTNENAKYGFELKANYICYDRAKQIKIFDLILEEIDFIIRSNSPYVKQEIMIMLNAIWEFIPFMKNYNYKNEEEYRICIQLHGDDELELNKIQRYRVFNGALIPYILLTLNKKTYFKSITASPFNKSELTLLGLKEISNAYPNKLEILSSKIPSRF